MGNLDGKATAPVDAQAVFTGITVGRWQVIRRALNLTTDEIAADNTLIALVVANEWNRKQNGNRDDWDRFNLMTQTELIEFLGNDTKSDDKNDEPVG